MGYVELQKNVRTASEKPVVTVGAQGIIYFNKFLMYEHFKGVEYVVFLFDSAKRRLAIKPVDAEKDNSFRLIFTTAGKSTGAIAARSVVKALGIDVSKKKQYTPTWSQKEKVLEIQL